MTTYWISNTCVLFNSLNIFPFGKDVNENFNAVARLIIFSTIVSMIIFQEYNLDNILLIGSLALVLSVILYFLVNRIFVNLSREEMIYKKPEILEPKYNNSKGMDNYENISSTKLEKGIKKDTDYSSFYKIIQTNF
jgi:amino acid transporter